MIEAAKAQPTARCTIFLCLGLLTREHLVNLTKALSQELGPHGIRINDVSPGAVSTDLWLGQSGVAQTVANATGVDPETALRNVLANIGGLATGRMTTPEEVATLVVMLASRAPQTSRARLRNRRRAYQDTLMCSQHLNA